MSYNDKFTNRKSNSSQDYVFRSFYRLSHVISVLEHPFFFQFEFEKSEFLSLHACYLLKIKLF